MNAIWQHDRKTHFQTWAYSGSPLNNYTLLIPFKQAVSSEIVFAFVYNLFLMTLRKRSLLYIYFLSTYKEILMYYIIERTRKSQYLLAGSSLPQCQNELVFV